MAKYGPVLDSLSARRLGIIQGLYPLVSPVNRTIRGSVRSTPVESSPAGPGVGITVVLTRASKESRDEAHCSTVV
jgi:hypothetical protein